MTQSVKRMEYLIPGKMLPGNVYRLRLDRVPKDAPGPWCVAVTDRVLLCRDGDTVLFASPDEALAAYRDIEEMYLEVMRRDGNA